MVVLVAFAALGILVGALALSAGKTLADIKPGGYDETQISPEADAAISRIRAFLAYLNDLPSDEPMGFESFRLNGAPIGEISSVTIPNMARELLSIPVQIRTRLDGNGMSPERQFLESLLAMESALKAIFGSSQGGRLTQRQARRSA